MDNLVHIEGDFGWFLGSFDNNLKHQHYALQLSIPITDHLIVKTDNYEIMTKHPILIKPNISHRIISKSEHFLLLINPASTIGHFWTKLIKEDFSEIKRSPAIELQALVFQKNTFENGTLQHKINSKIKAFDCFCSENLHQGDERINEALKYIKQNSDRIVSLVELADHIHLSEGRFLHLFKEQTGITYRRARLWSKIINAIQLLNQKSITEVAHEAGFSDSAHFSRTFKENFGFSPRDFLKISRFIQV